MKYKIRSLEFKRQIVEEALSGLSSRAAICRKYNIENSVLRRWQEIYHEGRFDNEPVEETTLQERIKELERIIGQLTMDNIFLKKALKHALSQQNESEDSSERTSSISEAREGDVKC